MLVMAVQTTKVSIRYTTKGGRQSGSRWETAAKVVEAQMIGIQRRMKKAATILEKIKADGFQEAWFWFWFLKSYSDK